MMDVVLFKWLKTSTLVNLLGADRYVKHLHFSCNTTWKSTRQEKDESSANYF